jgi:hypothetical protein
VKYKIDITWHLEDLKNSDARLNQLKIYRDRSDNYTNPDPEINQYWHRAIERELKSSDRKRTEKQRKYQAIY